MSLLDSNPKNLASPSFWYFPCYFLLSDQEAGPSIELTLAEELKETLADIDDSEAEARKQKKTAKAALKDQTIE